MVAIALGFLVLLCLPGNPAAATVRLASAGHHHQSQNSNVRVHHERACRAVSREPEPSSGDPVGSSGFRPNRAVAVQTRAVSDWARFIIHTTSPPCGPPEPLR